MSVIFPAVAFLILLGALGLIAILTVRAAYKLKKHHGYGKDDDFKSAHTALTWAAVVSWIAIAGIILVAVLLVVGAVMTFGEELIALASTAGLFIYLFMIITAILVFTCGVLTVKAAIDMKKSSNFKDTGELKTAYDDAIYASVIAFVSLAIIIIAIYFFYYFRKHAEKTKQIHKEIKSAKKRSKAKKSEGIELANLANLNSENPFQGLNMSNLSSFVAENPELLFV